MKRTFLSLLAAIGLLSSALHAQTYTIDDAHSNITFTIRHLVGRVTGSFTKYEGTFDYDPANPKTWKTQATIQAVSINTANEKRDEHLRSADFFDVQRYPTISFKSTGVTESTGNSAKLSGYLTMHGATKPVVLNLEFGGVGKDPQGNQRAGIVASTRVNRKDFGIIYNKTLETGGLMLGDDVDIVINVEGVAKK